jgi:hypothetical protein
LSRFVPVATWKGNKWRLLEIEVDVGDFPMELLFCCGWLLFRFSKGCRFVQCLRYRLVEKRLAEKIYVIQIIKSIVFPCISSCYLTSLDR